MLACYAWKNEIVRLVRYENPILQDMDIAMGAFRHKPIANENRFLTSSFLGMLRRNYIR